MVTIFFNKNYLDFLRAQTRFSLSLLKGNLAWALSFCPVPYLARGYSCLLEQYICSFEQAISRAEHGVGSEGKGRSRTYLIFLSKK